jgi:hypothetical protein
MSKVSFWQDCKIGTVGLGLLVGGGIKEIKMREYG